MKKCLLYLLLAALLFPAAAFAEEDELIDEETIERAELQLEMTKIQSEQQRIESELAFEQQMRDLQIDRAHLEMDQFRGHHRDKPGGLIAIMLLIALLNRILVPVWIYKDMRQRNASSVILVLLGISGGLFGLLVYGVVRIGDMKANVRTPRK